MRAIKSSHQKMVDTKADAKPPTRIPKGANLEGAEERGENNQTWIYSAT